jgi:hypothetical protein
MAALDPPVEFNTEIAPVEEYGLSAETMMSWLTEMVNIPKWRIQCDEDHSFYETNQLERDVTDEMKRRGQAPATIPYCSAAVDTILGMEAQTRTGVRVDTAPGETTPDVADALTVKLFNAVAEGNTDAVIAEAYHGQIVGGIDWVEVGRSDDPFKSGVKTTYVPYHEMWWDWRSKDVLLSDCRYQVRKKRYDFDTILANWPEVAPIIHSLGRGNRYQTWDYPQFGVQLSRGSDVDVGLREEEFEWFNTTRKTCLVYEVWYRQLQLVTVFDKDDGTAIEFDPDNELHVEALSRGLIDPYEAYTQRMRVSFWVGNIRVSDEPTPFPHNEFKYVPFFGMREKRYGTPYGLMRRMKGLQKLINNAASKVHFYMGANQVFYDERAFEDPNEAKKEINKPNFFLPVKADPMTGKLYEVNVQRGSQLLDPHINYLNTLSKMFRDVSGVHDATLGNISGEMSGSAADIGRQQDATGLAKINDNYRQSRKRVHELMLALIIEDLSKQRNLAVEVARDIGGPLNVVINKEVVAPDGTVTLENDVSKVNVRVVLEDIPKSETYNQQVAVGMAEIMKSSPPDLQAIMWPSYIKLMSGLPGHQRIAELLAKRVGLLDENGEPQDTRVVELQKQVQELQQKLEAKHPQELLEAQIAKLQAETANVAAVTERVVAEKVETMLKGFFEAINTANLVAQNPKIAPVADAIISEAGFKKPSPMGDNPSIPQPQQAEAPLVEDKNTHPNLPNTPDMPNPDTGIGRGIEGGQKPENI